LLNLLLVNHLLLHPHPIATAGGMSSEQLIADHGLWLTSQQIPSFTDAFLPGFQVSATHSVALGVVLR
jgi:hypothetical protein